MNVQFQSKYNGGTTLVVPLDAFKKHGEWGVGEPALQEVSLRRELAFPLGVMARGSGGVCSINNGWCAAREMLLR